MFGILSSNRAVSISSKGEKKEEKEDKLRFNRIYKKYYKYVNKSIRESSVRGIRSASIDIEAYTITIDIDKLMRKLTHILVDKGYKVGINDVWCNGVLSYHLCIYW